MTTIAWDGKTLAADRMATYSFTKRKVRKLFDCGDYAYGCSGEFWQAHLIADWLRSGAGNSGRVTQDEISCCGIAVRKTDGVAFVVEGKSVVLTEIRDEFFATGSGHEYARAAMALGKTAMQAIALASRFDVHTGLGVDTIRVRGRR